MPRTRIAGVFLDAVFTVLAFAIVAPSIGCATVAHGGRQNVSVGSDPPGAEVFVAGRRVGTTPLTLNLKRREQHLVLRLSKAGFTDATIVLARRTSGWIAVDLAFALNPLAAQGANSPSAWAMQGGAFAASLLAIDTLTGAGYKLPASVRATLSPVP